MSDRYLHHEGPERPSQDWVGGPADPRYARFDRALQACEGLRAGPLEASRSEIGVALTSSGGSPERQRAFEIIRDTLEDAGMPFIRANEIAERCYQALGEIL